jgi:hypothetical protein
MTRDEQYDKLRHGLARLFAGVNHDVGCAATLLKQKAQIAPQSCEADAYQFCLRAIKAMRTWTVDAATLIESEGLAPELPSAETAIAAGIAQTSDEVPAP